MKYIRKPTVAGTFYPEKDSILEEVVSKFLSRATQKISTHKKPKIIIVPHAGFIYSGQTAAFAYVQVMQFTYKQIIIIGPAHFYPIEGPVTSDFDAWDTPLGRVEVDKNLNQHFGLPILNDAFLKEHSIEVQLPFLQIIYSRFAFFPIFINSFINNFNHEFVRKLVNVGRENTLFIISTDLSHYYPETRAQQTDRKTIELIINKKVDKTNLIDACGQAAILTAMNLASFLNLTGELLYYDTSATASDDETSVVGYAAIGFFE